MKVGDIVWAGGGDGGLPYRAAVEAIRDGKAKLRPLGPTLTRSSARSRSGSGMRARWVTAARTEPALSDKDGTAP